MTSYSRRNFLVSAAALAGAAWSRPLGLPIGLQPYTVRGDLKQDCAGTLKKIAAIGYEQLELSESFYGMETRELQQLLKSLGMTTPAGHYGYPKDDSDWAKKIEHAKMFGIRYMITNTPSEWRKTLDGWRRAAARFNELGEQCRKAGIVAAYHNHHFEYKVMDGVLVYDELLRLTDPKLVAMELDCFWTRFAGHDPVSYLEKYPGRFPLLHIKGMKPGYKPSTGSVEGVPYTEVGSGIIDWKPIFQAAKKSGLKAYFVEQDECDRPPLDSIRISYDYLKKLEV